jgi:hypothetical protein
MAIDTTQILLMSAITILTVILTIVGIQLIFILRDARVMLTKLNSMVNELQKMGINVTHGYSDILGFFSGVKNVLSVIDAVSKKTKK